MALSGSKDYTDTFTAANLIALSLRRLGVLDPFESINSTEQANALVALNLILKEWSALGLDNWLRQYSSLWVTEPGSKNKYTLGPSGSPAATSWHETQLASEVLASATSISVTSISATHGIAGSRIGVKLDDGRIHFTTINGAPVGTNITLSQGLPSKASKDNRVYMYAPSFQVSRPSRILYASRSTLNGLDIEVEIIGMDEYQTLANKTQKGAPLCVYYEPTLTNGTLYIWPTGETSPDYDRINLIYNIYVDDLDIASNNAQFPPEWFNAISWQLAAEMAPEYGLSEAEQKRLWSVSQLKLDQLLASDTEQASVFFTRDVSR